MKNKTTALWLTLIAGPMGLHRVYLYGRYDLVSSMLSAATLSGLYGVYRARSLGLDDQLSWLLMPFLGFTMAGCALNAIVCGVMSTETWNTRFNPSSDPESPQGKTGKLTVAGLAVGLFFGTTVLMASLAFSFQRYFEYQVEVNRTQTSPDKKDTDKANRPVSMLAPHHRTERARCSQNSPNLHTCRNQLLAT